MGLDTLRLSRPPLPIRLHETEKVVTVMRECSIASHHAGTEEIAQLFVSGILELKTLEQLKPPWASVQRASAERTLQFGTQRRTRYSFAYGRCAQLR